MAMFRSLAAAEAFTHQDPFVAEGLVASFAIRPWLDEMFV